MKSALLRFWLCVGLFAGWIGLLIYLALTTRNPVILSRPQVLASTLDIVGQVTDPSTLKVKVLEVLWPEDQKGKLEGKIIDVVNLPECVRQVSDEELRKKTESWTEPGPYILPLVADGKGGYLVARAPRSPGFEPTRFKPHIYPKTKEALDQLAEIRKLPLTPAPKDHHSGTD
jgi:hypothetical protein